MFGDDDDDDDDDRIWSIPVKLK